MTVARARKSTVTKNVTVDEKIIGYDDSLVPENYLSQMGQVIFLSTESNDSVVFLPSRPMIFSTVPPGTVDWKAH